MSMSLPIREKSRRGDVTGQTSAGGVSAEEEI